MLYKNIEIHNIEELIQGEVGTSWLRFPADVRDKMDFEGGKDRCKNSTGVELRFIAKSDTVTLRMRALNDKVLNTFHIYRGGLQGGWDDHEVGRYVSCNVCDFEIKRITDTDMLEKMTKASGLDWNPNVIRVIFDRGSYEIVDVIGDVEPPSKEDIPPRTILFYGSSITHGSNAIDASHAWASIVSHNLNMDCLNKGMAGSCAMEPEVVNFIADKGEKGLWDVAVLELGINVLSWEPEKIEERVTNTLQQIAGRNPQKPIFVISPFYSSDDFLNKGLAQKWRNIINRITFEMAMPNVTYIDGLSLLGDMSLISSDAVHPNIYGAQQIADRLTDIMRKKL